MRKLLALFAMGAILLLGWGVASPARADTNCPDYTNQAAAQARYKQDLTDPDGLDGPIGPNNDTTGTPGVACENNACPCDMTPVLYTAATQGTTATTAATATTSATTATTRATTATTVTAMVNTGSSTGPLVAIGIGAMLVGMYLVFVERRWVPLGATFRLPWED